MTPIFDVKIVHGSQLRVRDLSLQNEIYTDETVEDINLQDIYYTKGKFKYSETCTVNIILYSPKDELDTDNILAVQYVSHDADLDESYYDLEKDGFYKIYHLILPTEEWVLAQDAKKKNVLDDIGTVYFVKDNTINKLVRKTGIVRKPVENADEVGTGKYEVIRNGEVIATIDEAQLPYWELAKASINEKIDAAIEALIPESDSDEYVPATHLGVLESQKMKIKEIMEPVQEGFVEVEEDYWNYEEVAPELLLTVNKNNTTLSRSRRHAFSIYYLQRCYVDLCKAVFEIQDLKCVAKDKDLQDVLFKRDFIWMTINVIKYYVEFDLMFEALRILNTVNFCAGFCKTIPEKFKGSGCGCGK